MSGLRYSKLKLRLKGDDELPDGQRGSKAYQRTRRWQLRRRAEGKCYRCRSDEDTGGKLCDECHAKQRRITRNWRRRKAGISPDAPLKGGGPRGRYPVPPKSQS